MADSIYGRALAEHNLYPLHRHELENATCRRRGASPSCGDDITLSLLIRDGIIEDGAFTGFGCSVSQASADIMLELVIGGSVEEARELSSLFRKMTEGKATAEELEKLGEAAALQKVSEMPARVKCALLGWQTLESLVAAALFS